MNAKNHYAEGLENIIANKSSLSHVDGKNGELIYCGYDINTLVKNTSFEETIFLLHNRKLPNQNELENITNKLRENRKLPKGIIDFIKNTPKKAVPMDVLRTAISMLGVYDPNHNYSDRKLNEERSIKIITAVPIIIAYFHRNRSDKDLPKVRTDLNEAQNFLYNVNGEVPDDTTAKTLDSAFTLHADHGMNASTFSARVTIATLSDFYSAITSAIGTLKGPLHGGANEGVIKMLKEIDSIENVEKYIEEKFAKKEKIMGIGHRVYRTLDPRAPFLREQAKKLCQKLGESKWIEMSEKIAIIMKNKKNLNANVDFFSATVYYSLGIPTDLFTPVFAIGRVAGWTAQVLEQLENNRLYRPLTEYTGKTENQKIIPISERK